jgi:hypothetical protein
MNCKSVYTRVVTAVFAKDKGLETKKIRDVEIWREGSYSRIKLCNKTLLQEFVSAPPSPFPPPLTVGILVLLMVEC